MGRHIERALLRDLAATGRGDTLVVGMLFLSARACLHELVAAHRRGVRVHVVLDNNQESFGAQAGGFPNRVAAHELLRRAPGMDVRWHRTDVEYHTKLVYAASGDRRIVHAGSANLTRRSLVGTNLETNVRLEMSSSCAPAREADRYVEKVLGESCSTPVSAEQDVPLRWRLAYRAGERVGLINC